MSILTPSIASAVSHSTSDDTISSTRSKKTKQVQKSAKRQMADYELPPRNYRLSDHYYHYGWPVTEEMLRKMLVKLKLPVPSHNYPDIVPANLGTRLMRWLRFPGGLNYVLSKPDEFCEEQNRVQVYEGAGKEHMRHVTFFSIGCTYSKEYYWRRPTQEGFEILIDVFGEEPRWLEDFNTKQEFTVDTIDWW